MTKIQKVYKREERKTQRSAKEINGRCAGEQTKSHLCMLATIDHLHAREGGGESARGSKAAIWGKGQGSNKCLWRGGWRMARYNNVVF